LISKSKLIFKTLFVSKNVSVSLSFYVLLYSYFCSLKGETLIKIILH
jgi:hypothetical protein